jgi:hypothetical protein
MLKSNDSIHQKEKRWNACFTAARQDASKSKLIPSVTYFATWHSLAKCMTIKLYIWKSGEYIL